MKKHYLKLTTIISSSILSYSLVVTPFISKATIRPKTPSSPVNSGINGRILFKPIDPANQTSTSGKLHKPTPIKPTTTKFNPIYDSDTSSIGSGSLRSISSTSSLGSIDSSISNTSQTTTGNNNTIHAQNQNTPNNSGNSKLKLKFTDLALMGITGMSLTGLGVSISQLVNKDNNKTENKPEINKPELNQSVNQN